jgi:integrase
MKTQKLSAQPRQTKPRRVRVPGKACIYRNVTDDGRTRYQFTYVDSQGKRRWKTVEGGLRDAEAARDEMRFKLRRGDRLATTKVKLEELAGSWLQSQTHLRPRTQEIYASALRLHVLPRLGRLRVSEINEDHVVALIRDMQHGGYATWTIRGTLAPLRRILKHAARRGIIAGNPFDRLEQNERPKGDAAPHRILQHEDVEAVLNAAPGRYRAALAVAIFTGLRRGEILGLRWCDIDFRAAELNVRHQLGRDGRLSEPKTIRGKRTIPLPPWLVETLAEHRSRSPHHGDPDFVFATAQGTPMDGRNFARRSLKAALKTAGLERPGQPSVRFHDLRHTFASMMINQGTDVEYLSYLLGHSSPDITLRVYVHGWANARNASNTRDRLQADYGHLVGGSGDNEVGGSGDNEVGAELDEVTNSAFSDLARELEGTAAAIMEAVQASPQLATDATKTAAIAHLRSGVHALRAEVDLLLPANPISGTVEVVARR